jgi:L-fuculose-phosphate aldolase
VNALSSGVRRLSSESELELRKEIVAFCRFLHQKNFLAANDGNVSARLSGGRILITPTGRHKGFIEPEELVVVDQSGNPLPGEARPSGEIAMHLAALRRRPDATVVIHSHPPTCIALSLLHHLRLNDILPRVILSIGEIVVVPYARPVSEDLGDAIAGYIERHDALILERHGTLTVGKTVAEAYARTERLEHAAHVLWLAYAVGRPRPLPEAESRALMRIYEQQRLSTD